MKFIIDQNILLSLQAGKISTGKAKELLEEDIKQKNSYVINKYDLLCTKEQW